MIYILSIIYNKIVFEIKFHFTISICPNSAGSLSLFLHSPVLKQICMYNVFVDFVWTQVLNVKKILLEYVRRPETE